MKPASENTVLTLGCAIQLGGNILREMMGTDIANTLNGQSISQKQLYATIGNRLTRLLIDKYAKQTAPKV